METVPADFQFSAKLPKSITHDMRLQRPAWLMFDNTAHGHSVSDALRLQAKLNETA